jgi:DNA-binding response OmpR family regulator
MAMTESLLVVEDDDTARMLLTNVLKRAGYRVTAASDGETAIELLSNPTRNASDGYPYDVVITDIRMQGLDGIEVMHIAIKQKPPPSVILMTGYSSVETAVAALRANAYDYLMKPCDTADLLRCVSGALHHRVAELQKAEAISLLTRGLGQLQEADYSLAIRSESSVSSSHEFYANDKTDQFLYIGKLCLDIFRHTAMFDNRQIPITPIEFDLLRCLAEQINRVITYQDIVVQTHGTPMSIREAQALLRTHVSNLRRKIDPEYIVNVRGIGYLLNVPCRTFDPHEEL